jgi:hypothetical protein
MHASSSNVASPVHVQASLRNYSTVSGQYVAQGIKKQVDIVALGNIVSIHKCICIGPCDDVAELRLILAFQPIAKRRCDKSLGSGGWPCSDKNICPSKFDNTRCRVKPAFCQLTKLFDNLEQACELWQRCTCLARSCFI